MYQNYTTGQTALVLNLDFTIPQNHLVHAISQSVGASSASSITIPPGSISKLNRQTDLWSVQDWCRTGLWPFEERIWHAPGPPKRASKS